MRIVQARRASTSSLAAARTRWSTTLPSWSNDPAAAPISSSGCGMTHAPVKTNASVTHLLIPESPDLAGQTWTETVHAIQEIETWVAGASVS